MRGRVGTRTLVAVGLLVSLLLAAVVSLWAATTPDGLEHVAGQLGFADTEAEHGAAGSPFADYGTAGLPEGWSEAVAGTVGVVVTGLLAFGLAWLLRRRGSGVAARTED
ncbi:PDGLE domain-containing protein [Ornithinicoccus halotolerans]|uniref:PDGLE domain-containing protein n=1 Tax=Ornithinicoccus halotolerans TaxID=1748220 RepID=UPI001E45D4BD|nr:PDGLE domain-containing protein [Ornithinicoccus halotolerans]